MGQDGLRARVDIAAMLEATRTVRAGKAVDDPDEARRQIAEFCRYLGTQLLGKSPPQRKTVKPAATGATREKKPVPSAVPVDSKDSNRGTPQAGVVQNPSAIQTTAPTVAARTPRIKLSPRQQQTLELLLAGDSEKQIARKLKLSPHTVHVYVKAIYRSFGVNSRAELLARFVQAPKFHLNG
jgi:DNA-binding CsgD family transcriptional regulator